MRRPSDRDIVELTRRLVAFFSRRVDPGVAEDLAHETLTRALESGASWDPARGTWAMFVFGAVARSVLRDYRRDRSRFVPLFSSFDRGVERDLDAEIDRAALHASMREDATGDPVVMLMLERFLGDDAGIGELWRFVDAAECERHNARRRLKRLIQRRHQKGSNEEP